MKSHPAHTALRRLLLVAGLVSLLFVLFAFAASADTQVPTGTLTLNNVDLPKDGVQTAKTPYLSSSTSGLTAAINTISYRVRAYKRTPIQCDLADYVPAFSDNEGKVQICVVVSLKSGCVWKLSAASDYSLYPMTWNGQTVIPTKTSSSQPALSANLIYVFDTYVAGTIQTIDLELKAPPETGALSDETVTDTLYSFRVFRPGSDPYPYWRIDGGGSKDDPPAVWQGGTKVVVEYCVTPRAGCSFATSPTVKLNGVSLPKKASESDDAYWISKLDSQTWVNFRFTYNLPADLNTTLDLRSGPVTITNPDRGNGPAERMLNALCALAGTTPPGISAATTTELNLNGDDNTDLILVYTPRVLKTPLSDSIPASLTVTRGPGLWTALGQKTEKTLTLAMEQQAALAAAGKLFWQKLTVKTTTPQLTVDPNGGAFKNGSTTPAAFRTDSSGKLSPTAFDGYMSGTAAENFGLTRSGYAVLGFAQSATATSPTVTQLDRFYDLTYSRDCTYYVLWKKLPQVTIDPNGGRFADGTSTPITLTCNSSGFLTGYQTYFTGTDADDGYGLTPPEGKLLAGFSTKKDDSPSGAISTRLSNMKFTGDTTVYLIWYTPVYITVDPDGGAFPDGTTAPKTNVPMNRNRYMSQTVFRQLGFNDPGKFRRDGYRFVGVSLTKTGELLYTKDRLDDMTSNYTGHYYSGGETLYIRWAKEVTVKLDLNGGFYLRSNSPGRPPQAEPGPMLFTSVEGDAFYPNYPNSSLGLISDDFVREGCKAVGWGLKPDDKTPACGLDEDDTVTVPANGLTLYLLWEVPSALTITQQPASVQTKESGAPLFYGDDAAFTVWAAGKGLSYQWQSAEAGTHGTPLPSWLVWTDLKGETKRSLTVKAGFEDHAGRVYRCLVKDSAGATVLSGSCWCEPMFAFTDNQPYPYTGKVGETAVFRVSVSAPAPTYKWNVKDKNGAELPSISMVIGAQDATSAELQVPIAAMLDGMKFYCVVYDTLLKQSITSLEASLAVGQGVNRIEVDCAPFPKAGESFSSAVFTVTDPAQIAPDSFLLLRVNDEDFAQRVLSEGYFVAAYGYHPAEGAVADVKIDEKLQPGVYVLSVVLHVKPSVLAAFNAETLQILFNGRETVRNEDWILLGDSVCGLNIAFRVDPPHEHTLKKTAEVPATCAKDGTKAYWKCEGCGRIYADAEGKNEISAPETVPATGKHTLDRIDGAAATCVLAGTKTYYRCSVCGGLFADAGGKNAITAPETIPPTGEHKWDGGEITKQPTVESEGVKTYRCTVCGVTKTEPVPKLSPDDPTPPKPEFLFGDVDNSGDVTAADARLALRRAVELENYAPGSREFIACDVDKDDAVTAADARLILRAAVELEDPTKW